MPVKFCTSVLARSPSQEPSFSQSLQVILMYIKFETLCVKSDNLQPPSDGCDPEPPERKAYSQNAFGCKKQTQLKPARTVGNVLLNQQFRSMGGFHGGIQQLNNALRGPHPFRPSPPALPHISVLLRVLAMG